MGVQGHVARHGLVEVVLGSAVLGCVPALERVTGAHGRGHGSIWAAVLYGPGRLGGLAAVAVERERVRVHRPVGVQGHVARHGLVEVALGSAASGRVPALERVAGAGRIGRLRGLGPVPHRLRGHRGAAVRVESNRKFLRIHSDFSSCWDLLAVTYCSARNFYLSCLLLAPIDFIPCNWSLLCCTIRIMNCHL